MKLKRHREDVKWMKEYAILPLPYLDEIAYRYHRLILAMEETLGPFAATAIYTERRLKVIKDAE